MMDFPRCPFSNSYSWIFGEYSFFLPVGRYYWCHISQRWAGGAQPSPATGTTGKEHISVARLVVGQCQGQEIARVERMAIEVVDSG